MTLDNPSCLWLQTVSSDHLSISLPRGPIIRQAGSQKAQWGWQPATDWSLTGFLRLGRLGSTGFLNGCITEGAVSCKTLVVPPWERS